MIRPCVSVIIPAHNGDRFIAAAVESVLGQTYQNFEIIVVDDGSTDRTATVLKPYFDRIRYVRQTNQGVAIARNRGVQLSRGELIAFLDQDDTFLPDKLSLQVGCFEASPRLGIVHSGWNITNSCDEIVSSVQPWQGLPVLDLIAWIEWKPVFLGAMLFQKAWLERAALFNARFEQTNDVDLVLRLALLGCEADWIKQATVNYRQHENNTSNNVLQQVRELEVLLNNLFQRSDLSESVSRLESRSRYQSLVWSAWRLYQNGALTEMFDRLEQSLLYKNASWSETVIDWLDKFQCYSKEYGEPFNCSSLTKTQAWQELMQVCMRFASQHSAKSISHEFYEFSNLP